MVNILFVCLGNICRSTMAETIMRHMVLQAGLESKIAVDSAGTSGWHTGEPPHHGTQQLLRQNGISFDGISSRPFTGEDSDRFDYIVGMDEQNIRDILRIAPGAHSKAALLSAYADGTWTDVPDPWYTKNYTETFQLVSQGCKGLLSVVTRQLK